MAEVRVDWVDQQIGDYKLLHFLGQGSFGDVYLGMHVSDGSLAAIKVLRVRLTEQREVKSFINETRMIRLAHPNIVRVLDFGISEDNVPFIVMEYASNGTLRRRHQRGTCLSVETIIEYMKQIADALQYAHNRRLIHRDVKPENILLGSDFELLLSDFGIATVAHSTSSARTEDKAGTIYYMAPEQIDGRPVPASDQYALGIIAYEWLCGECPFRGNAIEIAIQHSLATPPSLCDKVSGLAPEVEQVVMKALAKDPKDRFTDVVTFARSLKEAAQPKPLIGTTLLTYSDHIDEIRTVAWSPDGIYIASGSADKTVQVWQPIWTYGQVERVESISVYNGHRKGINALAWSPDARYIASASLDQTAQVWDAATGGKVLSYSGHTGWVRAIAWSPDGKFIASGAWDGAIHVWDARTGEPFATYSSHADEVRALAWSPDSKLIVSGSADRTVQVWSLSMGETLVNYEKHSSSVNTANWSPDGQFIASGSLDGTVQVWNASTGEFLMVYTGHTAGVSALDWSPDGQYIASGARDNTVHIWRVATGDHIDTYTSHTDWLMALAWSPDSGCIVSGSVDKTVHIWQSL